MKVKKKEKSVSATAEDKYYPDKIQPTYGTLYELYCELMQTRAGLLTVSELVSVMRVDMTEQQTASTFERLKQIKDNVVARKAKLKK